MQDVAGKNDIPFCDLKVYHDQKQQINSNGLFFSFLQICVPANGLCLDYSMELLLIYQTRKELLLQLPLMISQLKEVCCGNCFGHRFVDNSWRNCYHIIC